MAVDGALESHARLIFMGETGLCDGFRLVGFETHDHPSDEAIYQVLSGLLASKQTALVVIDPSVAGRDLAILRQVRAEGGRVVLAAVPSLTRPELFPSDIEAQVRLLLGDSEPGAEDQQS